MGKLKKVRDRNGTLVPFKVARIAAKISAAVRDAGGDDGVLADELAAVVSLFLEKRFDDDNPPTLDDIRDLTAKVLSETGHARIAQSYLRIVEAIGPADQRAMVSTIEVIPQGFGLIGCWNAAEISQALLAESSLDSVEADAVAAGVETRLLSCGLARVSLGLVREFLDVELAARGHQQVLSRFRILGVQRREVDALMFPDGPAADPEEACGRAVLEDYALEAVHSKTVSLAHAEGRLHILGLGNPQRVESVELSALGPMFPVAGDAEEFLLHLVTQLAALRPLVRGRVVLNDFSRGFSRIREKMARSRIRRIVRVLIDRLSAVDVFGRPVFPRLDLEIELSPDASRADADPDRTHWLALGLLEELDQRAALRGRVGLVFKLSALPPYAWPESPILDALLRAARRHRGVALRLERRRIEPPTDNRAVRLDVAAVAVNVPFALAEARVRALEDVGPALAEVVGLAAEAVSEKYWFLRQSAPQTLRGLLANVDGGADLKIAGDGQRGCILMSGLAHAVELLVKTGVVAHDGRMHALGRILAYFDYALGEPGERRRLEWRLGGLDDRAARRRLFDATGVLAALLGDERTAAALAGVPEDAPALPLVSPLLSTANDEILRSAVTARLGAGLPLPARGSDEVVSGSWLRALFESTTLEYFEMEERADTFEVQERLFAQESES